MRRVDQPADDETQEPVVRLVQVGLGGFGQSWASQVVTRVPGARLVACVDTDPDALETALGQTGLPPDRMYSGLPAALEDLECDAVLVTAPVGAHVPSALAALQAGKHVLVEKPFASTVSEAQEAVDLAQAQGLTLMVSQNYRFFPAVRAVAGLVEGGEYGQVDAVHVDFRQHDNGAPREGHRHYLFPEPMVVDMAIHHFDLMRVVLGCEPVEIYCASWNPPWSKFDQPAEAMAVIRFEGDTFVSYRGSWLSRGTPTAWAGEWRMELAEAEVSWTSRGGRPLQGADRVTVRSGREQPTPLPLPDVPYVDREGSLAAFLDAIRTGAEPETSGWENLKTLALTLAAVESAQTNRPVLLRTPQIEDR